MPAPMKLDAELIWSCVDRRGGDSACWPWLRMLDGKGRGRFNVSTSHGRRNMLARNLIYYLTYEELPQLPMTLLRICPTPSCCNPRHQQICAPVARARVMRQEGRLASCRPRAQGESNHFSVLKEPEVREIIEGLADGQSGLALARRFHVTPQLISLIKLGKKWRHVPRVGADAS